MSNSADLITIMSEIDGISARLRAIGAGTASVPAACQLDAARDCLVRAKMRLAASLGSLDPIIDLVAIPSLDAPRHVEARA